MSGILPKKFAIGGQDEYSHDIDQMKRVYNQWVEINEIIQNGGDNKEELDNAIAKLQHYNGDKVRANQVFSPELLYRIEEIMARLENSSNTEQLIDDMERTIRHRSQSDKGNPNCCIVS